MCLDSGVEFRYGESCGRRERSGEKDLRMCDLYRMRVPYTSKERTLYDESGRGGLVGSGSGIGLASEDMFDQVQGSEMLG